MTTLNPIADLQDDVASRLEADSYFSDITVLTERAGNLDNKIARALDVFTSKDDKIGVAVLVGLFSANAENPDAPGPWFSATNNVVTVFENPMINEGDSGTGKAAVDIAVRIAQLLHHYRPGGLGQTIRVMQNAITPVPAERLPQGKIGYNVNVELPADSYELDKVAACTITPASGTVPVAGVEITCPTEGASIYYTLDGTYPWSGNAAAMLYSAAFTVADAAMLRAVAHKTDMAASDAAFVQYT